MSERTDHIAEAEALLIAASTFTSSDMPIQTGEEKADMLAEAQVRATLALVEQQRINNLIALASMAEDDRKHEALAGTLGNEAVWTLATTKMIGLDDEFEITNPDIAAALGIEVQPMTAADWTAMTDKTPPYVIDFDDIRKGMTVERQWEVGGEVRHRAEAVADHLSEGDTAWLTPGGYLVASDEGSAVLRVLAEPPKPALPTEPGTVIRCTLDAERAEKTTAILIRDGLGCWHGPDSDGADRYVDEADSDRITDWTVVYDPSDETDEVEK